MLRPVIILFVFIAVLSLAWLSSSGIWKKTKVNWFGSSPKEYKLKNSSFEKIKLKAAEAKTFADQNNYNESTFFLVDMSLPSGQNRFFVYDMKKDSLQYSGLVTHGRCNKDWLDGRQYGNTVGCGCTSLGKYKIGNPYTGRFGLAFKLYGLDKTNDKAFQRFVVLHSHDCVPSAEVTDDICQSDGCPTVSPAFLLQLKPIINTSKKPVLLWIYE
jgi:hypothetical protein